MYDLSGFLSVANSLRLRRPMRHRVSHKSVETPRREADPLLRGRGRFVDNIHLPAMLEAAFVRSAEPHALIRHVDKAAALALPGVHAVLRLDDLRPYLTTERPAD